MSDMESLEVKMQDFKELMAERCRGCNKLNEEKFAALEKALLLQAGEYERRLGLLNGEADRLRRMQETYVSRELYESHHGILEEKVSKLESFRDNLSGRLTVTSVIVAAIVSICVGLVIWFITGR
jgi:hypothetical protein